MRVAAVVLKSLNTVRLAFTSKTFTASSLAQEPEENQVPRVSTYRMAGHLATAFTIFSALVRGMLWVASCC